MAETAQSLCPERAAPKAFRHDFFYRGGELFCEKVSVRDILARAGTPVYIYSHKTIAGHLAKIQTAFRSAKPLICYSMKANSNLAVLKTLVDAGAGLDIVSGGELYRAKCAGCDPQKIVFAGVGKTEAEIRDALAFGILLFNAESEPELERIHEAAKRMKKVARVSLRVNPDVDADTHAHITTGKAENKFGIDLEKAKRIFLNHERYPALSFCGIHVHIGSQIISGEPFVKAFRKILGFVDQFEKRGPILEYLNLGGGLGVIYSDENPQTARDFARNVLPLFRGRKFRLILEPGRFIAANAGILVTKVLYVKKTGLKNFAICDAAMNDLIRPALYEAHHRVWPVQLKDMPVFETYDIVGPICESGDILARDRRIQELGAGDYLAVMTSGAYGFSMSSNYNSRPRACEVMVRGERFETVRRRETFRDLVRGETFPAFLEA